MDKTTKSLIRLNLLADLLLICALFWVAFAPGQSSELHYEFLPSPTSDYEEIIKSSEKGSFNEIDLETTENRIEHFGGEIAKLTVMVEDPDDGIVIKDIEIELNDWIDMADVYSLHIGLSLLENDEEFPLPIDSERYEDISILSNYFGGIDHQISAIESLKLLGVLGPKLERISYSKVLAQIFLEKDFMAFIRTSEDEIEISGPEEREAHFSFSRQYTFCINSIRAYLYSPEGYGDYTNPTFTLFVEGENEEIYEVSSTGEIGKRAYLFLRDLNEKHQNGEEIHGYFYSWQKCMLNGFLQNTIQDDDICEGCDCREKIEELEERYL